MPVGCEGDHPHFVRNQTRHVHKPDREGTTASWIFDALPRNARVGWSAYRGQRPACVLLAGGSLDLEVPGVVTDPNDSPDGAFVEAAGGQRSSYASPLAVTNRGGLWYRIRLVDQTPG